MTGVWVGVASVLNQVVIPASELAGAGALGGGIVTKTIDPIKKDCGRLLKEMM